MQIFPIFKLMLNLNKRVLILISFICLVAFSSQSKTHPLLDSLKTRLNENLQDTIRYDILKNVGDIYWEKRNDTAVLYFTQAAEIAKKLKDAHREGEAYHSISKYYAHCKKFTESYTWLNKLEEFYQQHEDTFLLLKVIFTKIELYKELDQLSKVAELHEERIKIYHAKRDTLAEIKTFYVKGWTEFNARLFREGISDLNKGKILTEKTKAKKNLREMLQWTGACYNGLKMFDSALYFQHQVYEYDILKKDTFHLAEVYRYTGDIYYKKRDFNTALDYYTKSVAWFLLARNKGRANLLVTYKARALDSLKRYKEAAAELTVLFNDKEENRDAYIWFVANEVGKDVYAKSGDLLKSINCFREYEKLDKANRLDEAHQEILIAEFKKEQEKDKALRSAKEKEEAAIKQYEDQKQKTIRNSLIVVVIFITLFAISIFVNLRRHKKASKIISLQKEQLFEKNKSIIDSIEYAKRIQNALITSTHYIEKTLNRLMKP